MSKKVARKSKEARETRRATWDRANADIKRETKRPGSTNRKKK